MDISYHTVNVFLPNDEKNSLPIEIHDDFASLRYAFIEREDINELPTQWRNVCGFYILFSPPSVDGKYSAYVGMTKSDFSKRLRSHDESKDWWNNALLVYRDTKDGFTSTQAAALEGFMTARLDSASNIILKNVAPTGDATLANRDISTMNYVIDSTLKIMRLRGYKKLSQRAHSYANEDMITVTKNLSLASPLQESSEEDKRNSPVFQAIWAWRSLRAKENRWQNNLLPAKTLQELIDVNPTTLYELRKVSGFGKILVENYGEEILGILANN